MIDIALLAVLAIAILASLVFTIPVPAIPLIVTACGITLTWRVASAQRKLAEHKLFLDLMQRRAEWYDRVKRALEGRWTERREFIEVMLKNEVSPPPNNLSALWQLETEAGWLFSPDMLALMAMMIDADKMLFDMQLKARQGDHQAAIDVGKMDIALRQKQGDVQDYLVQYLYVGDIGKPKRSPLQFAKVQRRGPFGLLGPNVIRQDELD